MTTRHESGRSASSLSATSRQARSSPSSAAGTRIGAGSTRGVSVAAACRRDDEKLSAYTAHARSGGPSVSTSRRVIVTVSGLEKHDEIGSGGSRNGWETRLSPVYF